MAIYDTLEEATAAWNHRAIPDNPPLTLEQLQEMAHTDYDDHIGTHIWVRDILIDFVVAAIIDHIEELGAVAVYSAGDSPDYLQADYGKTWLAYRYKPEEER